MTKQQEKEIRELRQDRKALFWVGFIVGVFLIQLIFVIAGITGKDVMELKQELQSCQEKVPVWELNVVCSYANNEVIKSWRNFTDYEDYLDYKEFYSRKGKCEVIE